MTNQAINAIAAELDRRGLGFPFDNYVRCPDCRRVGTMRNVGASATEPHGESREDYGMRCRVCGAVYTDAELEKIAAEESEK